jgi:hypothetical protein
MTNKHRGPLNAPQTNETDAQFKARHKQELTRELQEYSQYLEAGGYVASGGYCRCCERYACGEGGVNHT